jgi:hypothetical protein
MSAPVRLVLLFLLSAFGLSWLFALPLWFGAGVDSPLFPLVAIAIMFTPAIAALVMVFLVERPAGKARALGRPGAELTQRRLFNYLVSLLDRQEVDNAAFRPDTDSHTGGSQHHADDRVCIAGGDPGYVGSLLE